MNFRFIRLFVAFAALFSGILQPQVGQAQCTSPDIAAPSAACLQQNIYFSTTTPAASYEWDFCSGDLGNTPTASVLLNNFGGFGFKVKIVEQNGSYHGFFLSRGTGKLYRLDFANDITSQPTLVDLGGLGISSATWRSIDITQEGGSYFGFIIDNNVVYRVGFGTSLTNTPSAAIPVYAGGNISSPIDMVTVHDGSSRYMFIVNLGNNKIVRINFPSSWTDTSTAVSVDAITVPGVALLSGISFIKSCSKWYASVSAVSNGQVYLLAFSGGLGDANPATTVSAVSSPAGVALVEEDNHYYAFVQSQNPSPNADLIRLDYGSDLANSPVITTLHNIGLSTANGMWGFSMYKSRSDWLVLSVENGGSSIYKIMFPNKCFSGSSYSSLQNPEVTTTTAGSFDVTLKVTDAAGLSSSFSKTISVAASPAPDISFTSANICAQHDVNFAPINSSADINNYAWDFGDNGLSNASTPAHQFATAGSYLVSLVVNAASCQNTIQKQLVIYPRPVSSFTLPSPDVNCTNQPYTFNNMSAYNPTSAPTWQWVVNGVPAATSLDLLQNFSATGIQTIQLLSSIPGCSSQSSQDFIVQQQGSEALFSHTGNCQIDAVQFTNQTTGVNNYTWDFGDGNTAIMGSATHSYSATGTYNVKLTASNAAGCNNSITKAITINTKPVADFSLALPPFSCSGSGSEFADATPGPTDSNLAGWAWTFGDTGTSGNQNPIHTYALAGMYSVSLIVTTDLNCIGSVTKSVTISQSPNADFTNAPACAAQPTQFTDASGPTIKAWVWTVGSNTFRTATPVYTFAASGQYPVNLIVTGANGCVAQITKSITVPVPIAPDFTYTGNCAGKAAVFTDATMQANDPITARAWNFNNLGTGSGAQVAFTFSVTGNVPVAFTTTGQSGCSYTTTKTVNVAVAPVASFTATPESGPGPLTVQFTNTSKNASSYLWKFNDSSHATSAVPSPSFTYPALGDVMPTLTAFGNAGCSDVFSKPIHILEKIVDPAMSGLQFLTDPITGKVHAIVSITNNGNTDLVNPSVNIDAGGNPSTAEQLTISIAPGQSGMRTLKQPFDPATAKYVCVTVDVPLDIDRENNAQCGALQNEDVFLDLWPNPSTGTLALDWIAVNQGIARVVIVDVLGKIAFDQPLTAATGGLNQVRLDISNLTPGIYLVALKFAGRQKVWRLIRN